MGPVIPSSLSGKGECECATGADLATVESSIVSGHVVGSESSFVQITVSPSSIVILSGLRPFSPIETDITSVTPHSEAVSQVRSCGDVSGNR